MRLNEVIIIGNKRDNKREPHDDNLVHATDLKYKEGLNILNWKRDCNTRKWGVRLGRF